MGFSILQTISQLLVGSSQSKTAAIAIIIAFISIALSILLNEVDLNLVMTDNSEIIEIQGTGEEAPFNREQLDDMLNIGSAAIADIIQKQKACLK